MRECKREAPKEKRRKEKPQPRRRKRQNLDFMMRTLNLVERMILMRW
jgi:hypothetical protein